MKTKAARILGRVKLTSVRAQSALRVIHETGDTYNI